MTISVGYANTGSQTIFLPNCIYSNITFNSIGGGNGTISGIENIFHRDTVVKLTETAYNAEVGEEIFLNGSVSSASMEAVIEILDTLEWTCSDSDTGAVHIGETMVINWGIDKAYIAVPITCYKTGTYTITVTVGDGAKAKALLVIQRDPESSEFVSFNPNKYSCKINEKILINGTFYSKTVSPNASLFELSCSNPTAASFDEVLFWGSAEDYEHNFSIPVTFNKWGDYYIDINVYDETGNYIDGNRVFVSVSNFSLATDAWSFGNSDNPFSEGYKMDENFINLVESKLNPLEKFTAHLKYYYNNITFTPGPESEWKFHDWGGSCFGMVAAAALFHRNELSIKYWNSEANTAYDMEYNSSIRNLINYYQVLTVTDKMRSWVTYYNRKENKSTKAKISAIENFMRFGNDGQIDGGPFVLKLGINYGKLSHAVLLYGDIDNSVDITDNGKDWSFFGKEYQHRIRVYDPTKSVYANMYFYFSKENFIITDDIGTIVDYKDAEIKDIIPSNILADYLNLYNPEKSSVRTADVKSDIIEEEADSNLLQLYGSIASIEINSSDGKSASVNALSVDGDLPVYSFFDEVSATNGSANNINILIPNTDDVYTIRVHDSDALNMSMSYQNNLSYGAFADGNYMTFTPDGAVTLDMNNSNFTMAQVFNDGYYNTPWHTLTVYGNDSNTASIEKIGDDILFSCDNMQDIEITGENNTKIVTLTFSTAAEDVLLKAEDDVLVAYIDTDGDGNFDTFIAESEKQDTKFIITAAGIGGTVSGSGTYNPNDTVTLQAIPSAGYAFDGWYENNIKIDGVSEMYIFTAIENRTLEARFKITVIKGDLNDDGKADIEDAQLYLEYLVGNYELSETQKLAVKDYDNNNESAIKKLRTFLTFVTQNLS